MLYLFPIFSQAAFLLLHIFITAHHNLITKDELNSDLVQVAIIACVYTGMTNSSMHHSILDLYIHDVTLVVCCHCTETVVKT